MTFPAGVVQQQNGQQQPAPQGGWQQVPVPSGPVQPPNFNDPAFRGQQQVPQQVPQTQHAYDGNALQFPRPSFPQQQQQVPQQQMQQQAPQQQATVQVDPWGRPVQQAPQQQQWTQQAGQPSQQVPNQGQVQQQQTAQQPTGQVQFDAQGRMFGPGVPQELQGRTLQEGLQAYGMMRQTALGVASRPQQQVQQQATQQQAPPAQQIGAQAQARSFWADPEGVIDRIVEQRMAPISHQSQVQQVQTARDIVAQQFPQFIQYEGQVIERLQGMKPEVLANPEAWRLAFQQVVGEATLSGRFPGGGQQQGQQSQQQQAQQQGWQPYQNNGGPRYGDFFTESPAAGFTGGGTPSDGTFGLSPAQQEIARRFGITNQQYAQGMGAQ